MRIEKANKKEPKKDHGYILWGWPKDRLYFMQWFPSAFKAESYAKKMGWEVSV